MKINLNKNLKIFVKIFIFLLSIYIITFTYIQYCSIYFNDENSNNWFYLHKVLTKEIDLKDTTIKYIFLGESRLNSALDFKKIPYCWSFSYGGTTPVEQYFILKKYLLNYNKPDTIFYSVSPRFISETFSFWQYAVRNDFFTNDDFNEIISNYNSLNDTVLGNFPKIKFFLYQLNFISFYQTDIYKNRIFLKKSNNTDAIKCIQSHKGQSMHPNLKDSCSELNYETKYKYFTPSKLLDFYFNKILKLCSENNIKVIFLFMPMNESSYYKLNTKFTKDYKSYMNLYQEKFPEFEISDTIYHYPNIYFGDNSHLNFSGQQKFTNQFIEKYFK